MRGVLLSRDEAFELVFRRDAWLWLKVPAWLVLAWLFFVPQLWKIVVLLLGSWAAFFVTPGPTLTTFHRFVAIITMWFVWFAVLLYVIYTMAYLSRPGFASRAFGVAGILLFPVVVILSAVAGGGISALLGVPLDELYAYLDRWMPFASWKINP